MEISRIFTYEENETGITLLGYNPEYEGNKSWLSITSEIDGLQVTAIADQAFIDREYEVIIIRDNLATIGLEAFRNAPGVLYVNLLDGDTEEEIRGFNFSEEWEVRPLKEHMSDHRVYQNLFTSYIPETEEENEELLITGFTQDFIDDFLDGMTPTEITIPEELGIMSFDEVEVTAPDEQVFYRTQTSIETLPVEGVDFDSFDNTGLTQVHFQNIKTIKDNAFANNMITEVTVPDTVTTLGESAFENNDISSLTLPKQIDLIGKSAFMGNSLQTLVLTDIDTVGELAFAENELTSILIPDTVNYILDGAFYDNIGGQVITNLMIWDNWPEVRGYRFGGNWTHRLLDEEVEAIKDKVVIYDRFDVNFENPLAILGNVKDLKITEKLNEGFTLNFQHTGDQHNELLKRDNYVMVEDDIFKIRQVSRSKSSSGLTTSVSCDHLYFELLDDYIEKSWKAKSPYIEDLVKYVNKYTNFNIRVSPDLINNEQYPPLRFAIDRGNPVTVLYNITKMWGVELHRFRRQVSIVSSYNRDKLYLLATEKNIESISRTDDSANQVTRIYPKGGYNLSIEGMKITDIPYPLTQYHPEEGWLEVSYGEGFAKGIIYFKDGVITKPYIDTLDINNYPYPKKMEVTDTSVSEPHDLLGFGIRELNSVSDGSQNFSVNVSELKSTNGQLERFGLGYEVILKDDDVFYDEEYKSKVSRVVEYTYYPLETHKESSVVIGDPIRDAEDVITSLMETQKALEERFEGIKDEPDEPSEPTEPETPSDYDPIEMYTYENSNDEDGGKAVTGFNQSYLNQHHGGKIPSEIAIPPVITEVGESAFADLSFEKVFIPEGVVNIETNAFQNTEIGKLTLPNTLHSIKNYAFDGCGLLEVKPLANLVHIGDYAFRNNNLTKWHNNDLITEVGKGAFIRNQLTELALGERLATIRESAFENNMLTSIALTNSVTKIEDKAFRGNFITQVTIPNTVNTLGEYAFANNMLHTVNLPVSMQVVNKGVFANNKITKLTLPSTVREVKEEAFKDNNISNLTLNEGLETLGRLAFANNNINKLTLPLSLTSMINVSKGLGSFQGCPVRELIMGAPINYIWHYFEDPFDKVTGPQVKSLSKWVFYRSTSETAKIKELIIPPITNKIDIDTFRYNDLEKITIPDNCSAVPDSFRNNSKIREVNIGEGVTGLTITGNLIESLIVRRGTKLGSFANNKIASVIIEEGADISSLILNGNPIESLSVPQVVNNNVGSSFMSSVSSLKELTLDDSIVQIGSQAFKGVDIETLVLPSDIKTIYYGAFMDGNISGELIIPESMTNFPVTTQYESEGAFRNNNISKVTILAPIRSLPRSLFAGNAISGEQVLPEGLVNVGVNGAGLGVFQNNKITKVHLPSSAREIGTNAFRNNKITVLDLNNVDTIGSSAFAYNLLTEVDLKNVKTIGSSAFANNRLTKVDLKNVIDLQTSKNPPEYRQFDNNLITEVIIPENEEMAAVGGFGYNLIEELNIPPNIEVIGNFNNNPIKTLVIPDTVKVIGVGGAFSDCLIDDLTIGSGLQVLSTQCFMNNNLIDVVIPPNIKAIGRLAFEGNKLTSIAIPHGVETINALAFRSNNLTKIVLPDTVLSLHNTMYGSSQNFPFSGNPGGTLQDGVKQGVVYANLLPGDSYSGGVLKLRTGNVAWPSGWAWRPLSEAPQHLLERMHLPE